MTDTVGAYLVEQIRQKDELIGAMMAAKAATWEEGFSAACAQWLKQREEPEHPITRTNPYAWEEQS